MNRTGHNPEGFPPMNVAAYTQGIDNPPARFRVRQMIPALARHGIVLREFAAPVSAYPPRRRWLRPVWLPASLGSRIPQIVAGYSCDVTLLQREFISTLRTLENLTRRPRILDVDDAIFLHRRGTAARQLARSADLVICGNDFLANWFSRWNPRTAVLHTAVDCDRFSPCG